MTSRSINDLHPMLAFAWGQALAEWKLSRPAAPVPFLTATFRDNAEQDALFNQPRDGKDNNGNGKIDEPAEFVTNAKAGQSPHNYRPALAFDIAFKGTDGKTDYDPRLFDTFAPLVLKTAGITWGGNFKKLIDRPHFELTDWKKLAGI